MLRRQLLDVSKRNRLINTPIGKRRVKQLEIEDELSDQVFRTLYLERKKMTFGASGTAPLDQEPDRSHLPFLPDYGDSSTAPRARHLDRKLQTPLTAEGLQKRLLALYRDARTMEEEQGVSVLFLALGFLSWYESDSSDVERFAPLILIPVDLERDSARARFRLVYRDEDLEPNLSLGAMLANDFGLKLPEFAETDNWLPSEYFGQARKAVSSQRRWSVHANTIVLGFYSFAKFLMWRDLAPDHEGGLAGSSLAEKLLLDGFRKEDDHSGASIQEENLDELFADPAELGQILDADASQTRVIAAVREGRNLVVQGPPGTGKSQTIANIIAVAARDGKRVLFVAEKRAALDVVHSRLEKCGLGPLCLELHSHKAVRGHVYKDLKETLLALGPPTGVDRQQYQRVRSVRDELSRLSALLHRVDPTSGETPYLAIGTLSKLIEGGHSRPDFRIEGADRWSSKEFESRLGAVLELAKLTAENGSEREHPWRGVRRRLSYLDRELLAQRIREALRRLPAVRSSLARAAQAVVVEDASRQSAVAPTMERLDTFATAPDLGPKILREGGVLERATSLLVLCRDLASLRGAREELLAEVAEVALETEWVEARLEMAAHGESLFRWLRRPYREAVGRLRAVCRDRMPKDLGERLALLDRLLDHAARRRAFECDAVLGREALGAVWRGEDTELTRLVPALEWIAENAKALGSEGPVRAWSEVVPAGLDCAAVARGLRVDADEWTGVWDEVAESLDLDVATAFGTPSVWDVDWGRLEERFEAWLTNMESCDAGYWLGVAGRRTADLGLDALRERLAEGRLDPDTAVAALEFVRAVAIWERMLNETPELARIDGAKRSAMVERFKELDLRLQRLAAQEVALRHFADLPLGSAGQVGIVRGECNKKKRHMRLRRLLDTAGEAVAAIKPVFLMSPLSVAQFLSPGRLAFDLLLIDEASQVRPADAMGAIMRARQVVVVGDQKQLPPTSFFDRQLSGDEEVEYDDEADVQAMQLGEMESILSLCESRAMGSRMLKWHYRSMHPSLIKVSNHEFYGDRLVCPPSPSSRPGSDFGLSLVGVDGEYARGRRRNNEKEAEAVVQAVLRHAREEPGRTLGVVALSVAQRDTIRDLIEYMRTKHRELDTFCREGSHEPFFVKNLETVQGDERDVIFISIGYGRDANGYMAQSFGPVSIRGGERRLNVLFTRARQTCRVFSSIRHGDIRLDAARQDGPRVLKRFLKFAETEELDVPVPTGAEADSPFEEAVAKALERHGFSVVPQVGSAGFRIDLAVRDPDDEERFLLAVECDGARYHSSSWARERDRLRQAVLEQKGWRFHRIWSTDWFYDPPGEVSKLLDAIEGARSSRGRHAVEEVPEPSLQVQGRVEEPESVAVPRGTRSREPGFERVPYREASFSIDWPDRDHELHELDAASVAEYVVRIVEIEGPVHVDEVGRRLSRLWGYKQAGRRIQALVQQALDVALRAGQLSQRHHGSGRFLRAVSGGEVEVRDRSNVSSRTLRRVGLLPPLEVQAAVLQTVERNVVISVSDCAREVARAFGFKSTSADMRKCVAKNAERLVVEGRLLLVDGQLRLV